MGAEAFTSRKEACRYYVRVGRATERTSMEFGLTNGRLFKRGEVKGKCAVLRGTGEAAPAAGRLLRGVGVRVCTSNSPSCRPRTVAHPGRLAWIYQSKPRRRQQAGQAAVPGRGAGSARAAGAGAAVAADDRVHLVALNGAGTELR